MPDLLAHVQVTQSLLDTFHFPGLFRTLLPRPPTLHPPYSPRVQPPAHTPLWSSEPSAAHTLLPSFDWGGRSLLVSGLQCSGSDSQRRSSSPLPGGGVPSSAFLPPAPPSAFPPSPLCLVERLEATGLLAFLARKSLELLLALPWTSTPLTFTKQMFPPYLVSPFHVSCAPAPWSHAGSLPGACVSTHLLFAQAGPLSRSSGSLASSHSSPEAQW